MSYDRLNYIIAIAEEQNLTRAARRLYISQPTLTLYLNRLEAELEVKLFDRTKSPVVLTEAGKYYIEQMKKIAAEEQTLRNDIRFIANPDQTLVVGIGQVRGHHWLPMILPVFCQNHPGVNVQIVQSNEQYMSDALRTKRIDLVIGDLPASGSDLEIVDLMEEKMFLTAHRQFGLVPCRKRSKDFLEAFPEIPSSRLNGLPFIIPQVGNGMYDMYDTIVLGSQIHPSRTIAVSNLNTGFQLACQGLGVQLLSGSVLQMNEHHVEALEQMDFFLLEGMQSTRKCVAAFHGDSVKKTLMEDFIRIVRAQVLPNCHLILS